MSVFLLSSMVKCVGTSNNYVLDMLYTTVEHSVFKDNISLPGAQTRLEVYFSKYKGQVGSLNMGRKAFRNEQSGR